MRQNRLAPDESFFKEIAKQFKLRVDDYKLAFVMVTHTIPNVPVFLNAIEKCGKFRAKILETVHF